MDNLGSPQSSDSPDKPIPFDNGPDAPAPPKSPPSVAPAVSRAPLNLGGTGAGPAATTPAASPAPAAPRLAPRVQQPQVPIRKPVAAAPVGRITCCKTFFTKLHPGAIEFLDEQISGWLKENPGIVIRHTNMTTGDVQAKKTEPNLIITIWY